MPGTIKPSNAAAIIIPPAKPKIIDDHLSDNSFLIKKTKSDPRVVPSKIIAIEIIDDNVRMVNINIFTVTEMQVR